MFQGGVKPPHLTQLRNLEWNTSWTKSEDTPRTSYFYVLPLPYLKEKAGFDHSCPPPPRRALRTDQSDAIEHVIMTHATSQGGAIQILRDAKLRPSRLHFSYSQSFFRKSNNVATDRYELARINTYMIRLGTQSSLLFVTTCHHRLGSSHKRKAEKEFVWTKPFGVVWYTVTVQKCGPATCRTFSFGCRLEKWRRFTNRFSLILSTH